MLDSNQRFRKPLLKYSDDYDKTKSEACWKSIIANNYWYLIDRTIDRNECPLGPISCFRLNHHWPLKSVASCGGLSQTDRHEEKRPSQEKTMLTHRQTLVQKCMDAYFRWSKCFCGRDNASEGSVFYNRTEIVKHFHNLRTNIQRGGTGFLYCTVLTRKTKLICTSTTTKHSVRTQRSRIMKLHGSKFARRSFGGRWRLRRPVLFRLFVFSVEVVQKCQSGLLGASFGDRLRTQLVDIPSSHSAVTKRVQTVVSDARHLAAVSNKESETKW